MIYFYESDEDLALRGTGCLSAKDMFTDVTDVTGMDIADYIEALAVDNTESADLEERRDERSDSERMADRFSCWSILPALDITCAVNIPRYI